MILFSFQKNKITQIKIKYVILIFHLCITCLSNGFSQTPTNILQKQINISISKQPLSHIISEIEKQANVIFSYSSIHINPDSIISIHIVNDNLENVLKTIFANDISYNIVSNNIILHKDPQEERVVPVKDEKKQHKIVTDTIWVYKTDTVIRIKTDTIIHTLTNTIFDTITQIKYIEKEKKLQATYSAGIFFQPLIIKTYYQNFGSDTDRQSLKKLIMSMDKPEFSFRTGGIGSVYFNHIKLTTGLAYLRINEKFKGGELADPILENPDHPTFKTIDSIIRNMYNYLSVPLFVGKEYKINPNLKLGINIGGWFNILIHRKGCYVDFNSISEYYYIENLDNAPLNKLTIDCAMELSIEYKLFNRLAILVLPSYNFQILSDFKSYYPITKLRRSFGCNIGIISRF